MLEKTFGPVFYLKTTPKPKRKVPVCLPENYSRRQVHRPVYKTAFAALRGGMWRLDGRSETMKTPRTLNAYLDMLTAKVFQARKMLIEDDKRNCRPKL
jgi:hypothetical protein